MTDETKGDAERKGYWYQTYTGREVYPIDLRPEDIDIRDIAHSLALKCRFNGSCRVMYNVAQHSLHVHDYLLATVRSWGGVNRRMVLSWGLMHDAAEAYLGDITRPVKSSLQGVKEIEASIQSTIAERFYLELPMPEEVLHADNVLLVTEARDLMAPPPRPWGVVAQPWQRNLNLYLEPWQITERRFLEQAVELGIVGRGEAGL